MIADDEVASQPSRFARQVPGLVLLRRYQQSDPGATLLPGSLTPLSASCALPGPTTATVSGGIWRRS